MLTVGAIGGLGLSLTDFLRLKSAAAAQPSESSSNSPAAESVIFIFLPGGIAQQESFDPKPAAPLEYRGSFGTIGTPLPGVRFGELFSKTATIADRLTIVRSMTHGEAAHERGTHNMFTGFRPSPAIKYPSIGSVVSQELGSRKKLPPYVMVPNQPNPFAGSGFLSSAHAGFSIGADPADKNFRVRDLSLPDGVTAERFTRRQRMLDIVNQHFRQQQKSDAIDAVDSFYDAAYDLIGSPAAREAFDLDKESKKTRDEYGRNEAGARMLLARRLVESGVRFVTMTYGAWDHHDQIEKNLKTRVPPFDQAFAALIQDLDQRGMLDKTLVCVTSEFGRTPKINATAGRDHWPKVFSSLLAGGGIARGQVYGASDDTASEPADRPLTVEDWAATLYHCIGIDPAHELMSPGNRPIRVAGNGTVARGLLA